MVIDLFGLSAQEVLLRFPEVYQWIHDRVRTAREAKVTKRWIRSNMQKDGGYSARSGRSYAWH
jgi:hypothetical protein